MAASPGPETLGVDLLVAPFLEATEWDALDLTATDPGQDRSLPIDLAAAPGIDCLRQALLLRLLTPLGALADLGHPDYGSRLYQLVGAERNEAARLAARLYVLQAVSQEKRVAEVTSLVVERPDPARPDTLRISLSLRPVGGGDTIALGLEVAG
jgi:phage baseplate assembly protein W